MGRDQQRTAGCVRYTSFKRLCLIVDAIIVFAKESAMKKVFFCLFVMVFFFLASGYADTVKMTITSPAFKHQEEIPARYTCQGNNINPPLAFSNIPVGTKSFVLIVDDPDAPMGTWVHWVVFNILKTTISIAQQSVPGIQGLNDFGNNTYGGPCPPSGTHRYFFKLYALDTILSLIEGSSKATVEKAMQSHILSEATLIGLYKKH